MPPAIHNSVRTKCEIRRQGIQYSSISLWNSSIVRRILKMDLLDMAAEPTLDFQGMQEIYLVFFCSRNSLVIEEALSTGDSPGVTSLGRGMSQKKGRVICMPQYMHTGPDLGVHWYDRVINSCIHYLYNSLLDEILFTEGEISPSPTPYIRKAQAPRRKTSDSHRIEIPHEKKVDSKGAWQRLTAQRSLEDPWPLRERLAITRNAHLLISWDADLTIHASKLRLLSLRSPREKPLNAMSGRNAKFTSFRIEVFK